MIQDVLNAIQRGLDPERVWRRTEAIWRSDRWMGAAAWRRTSEYVAAEMEAAGAAEAECFACPADGESECFGQRMWPAWEVTDAKLEIIHPAREVLGHYRRQPRALMTHSAPTPPGGVSAELVCLDDGREPEHYQGKDVAGKIVFTRAPGDEVAPVAAKMGAVGVLSDFLVRRDLSPLHQCLPTLVFPDLLPDPPDWNQHLQWMHISNDRTGLFGFVLSPAEGEKLRRRLRRQRLVVHAVVKSAFVNGTTPAVTCVLPGSRRQAEQVIVVSHLFEQGANDNASGCAAALEAASSLAGLIRDGMLPRPRRSIRLLQGLEWLGPMGYLDAHREQIPRTRAGLCLDCVGSPAHIAQTPLTITGNPPDRPSYTDPLIEWITGEWLRPRDAAYHWKTANYRSATDNVIAREDIGIPCPWIGDVTRHWHTTADTMETLSRLSLLHASAITAAYCYLIARADARDARLFLALCESYGQQRIAEVSSWSAASLLQAGRRFGEARDAAVARLREEIARSTQRLQTVLPLVGPAQREQLRTLAKGAAARVRSIGRIQEHALTALVGAD